MYTKGSEVVQRDTQEACRFSVFHHPLSFTVEQTVVLNPLRLLSSSLKTNIDSFLTVLGLLHGLFSSCDKLVYSLVPMLGLLTAVVFLVVKCRL